MRATGALRPKANGDPATACALAKIVPEPVPCVSHIQTHHDSHIEAAKWHEGMGMCIVLFSAEDTKISLLQRSLGCTYRVMRNSICLNSLSMAGLCLRLSS